MSLYLKANLLQGGGEDKGWSYVYLRCGDGCCITTTEYCLDANGEMVVSDPVTESWGDCDPLPPSNWEIKYCVREAEPCKMRCGFN